MNAQQLKDTSKVLEESVSQYYWYTVDKESCTQIIVYALASKFLFGKIRVQVTPIFGVSSFWVDKEKHLKLIENPKVTINKFGVTLWNEGIGGIQLSPFHPNLQMENNHNVL